MLSAAAGWYFYSALLTVQEALPVEIIGRRPEQAALITSLSRVSTSLEALRREPAEGRLVEFTLALNVAVATLHPVPTEKGHRVPDHLQAIYDEIDWLLNSLERLATNAPPLNEIRAKYLYGRLGYAISELRIFDAETTREALRILNSQVGQIQQLRQGALVVLAVITVSLGVMILLLIWQRHTISLLTAARSAVRKREAILEAVSYSAEQFLMKTEWEKSIGEVLVRLGRAAEVNRIYIFENHINYDQVLLAKKRFEWIVKAFSKQMGKAEIQEFAFREVGLSRWEEILSSGEGIYGHVDEFPLDETNLLIKQNIMSIAVVPIFVGNDWWGFMRFDVCKMKHEWTIDEVEALKAAANTLGAAILRQRAEREIKLSHKNLEAAKLKAEEAMQVKSRFLATMSHELRSPLNSIIGFTRLVKRKTQNILPEKQSDNLEKVLISSDHLLMLINDVLDLTKLENNLMPIQPVDFTLEPLIDECLQTFEPMVKQKGLRLVKELEEDPLQLYTDKVRVKQIFINLLSNAVKFTERGKITVSVRRLNGKINIVISDTGIGIPEEKQGYLFKDFQQLDDSTTRQHGGTGLGLSISRRLARLMEGDISFESNEGEGSTFIVTIPERFTDL
jgi:signal transduction histidine kinase